LGALLMALLGWGGWCGAGCGCGVGGGAWFVRQVVDIIKKRKGHMVGQTEEVEIDIDALDNQTLRELDKYVSQCLNPTAPASSRKAAGAAPAKAAPAPAMAGGPATGPAGWAGAKAGSSGSDSDSDSDYDSDKEGLVASGAWDGTARPG
jgi:hypothetical protein